MAEPRAGTDPGSEPRASRLSTEEMQSAALEGRQVGGPLDPAAALPLLRQGDLTLVGRLLAASNATFFCIAEEHAEGRMASCVYKPGRGERPLFDFPDGTLACREVAAYELSEAAGLGVIPPTVLREGPLGTGMVQLWVETDPATDVAQLIEDEAPALRRIALLDAVMNNADRKGGHLLPLPDGRILGIDNGLCFAVEPKLRTILWQWRGQPLSDDEIEILERLAASLDGELGKRLRELLAPDEVKATGRRIAVLLNRRRFPLPDPRRPAIPWPPF